MFTGIIEETGKILSIKKGAASSLLTIQAPLIVTDVKDGDSIAVNGVCLTATSHSPSSFTADIMHETLNRSSLSSLQTGDMVNLERAVMAGGRLGGHIVSGHIDGIGSITQLQQDDIAWWYTIKTSPSILRYIVEKGSIAIDGISLTVAKITENDFSVSVIPHTARETTLSQKKIGDIVNLENDCIGKYVEKLLKPQTDDSGLARDNPITREFLEKYGF